jgi:hypothetical protein
MPNEWMFLRQALGSVGEVWLAVTLLAGLIVVLVFRPERVQHWGLFRAACWMVVLSVVVPPVLNVWIALAGSPNSSAWGSRSFPIGSPLILSCIYLVGPLLEGLGILFGLWSLIPKRPGPPPWGPPKHPLE